MNFYHMCSLCGYNNGSLLNVWFDWDNMAKSDDNTCISIMNAALEQSKSNVIN